MKTIEELMRENLKDAEKQPPEEVWERISERLSGYSSQSATTKPGESNNSFYNSRTLIIAISAIVLSGILFFSLHSAKSTVPSATPTLTIVENNHVMDPSNLMGDQFFAADSMSVDEITLLSPEKSSSEVRIEQRETMMADSPVPDYFECDFSDGVATLQENVENGAPNIQPVVSHSNVMSNIVNDNQEANPVPVETTVTVEPSETSKMQDNTVVHPANLVSDPNPPIPQINIPNIVSPNGDGINDCWIIKDLHQFRQVHVQIFTANGRRVFSSERYHDEFCGDDMPDGNYFYVLVVSDINYSRRGVVVIRR